MGLPPWWSLDPASLSRGRDESVTEAARRECNALRLRWTEEDASPACSSVLRVYCAGRRVGCRCCGAATDRNGEDVVVRAHPLRRPRLCPLRLHARSSRTERMQRCVCSSVAAVHREITSTCGHGRHGSPARDDETSERLAPGHVCRTAALLLRRRPETGADSVPERHRVRRRVARCSSLGTPRRLTN